MSRSSTITFPFVTVSTPPMTCSSVDLPEPDAPTTARLSPFCTVRFTSSSAQTRVSPLPYIFVTCSIFTISMLISLLISLFLLSYFFLGAILLFSVSLLLPVFLFFSFCWSKYSFFQLFPQSSLLVSSAHWSKYSVFQLFAPIQLACLFCPLEQIFCFSAFCPNPACFFLLSAGANILFFSFSPNLACFFLLGVGGFSSILAFCPNPACFFLLPVGANILFFSFSPNQSPAAFRSSAIRFDIRFIGI